MTTLSTDTVKALGGTGGGFSLTNTGTTYLKIDGGTLATIT
jgi:hypothetical protein